ncbi:hypothetical protein RND71_014278 [Anisodus tanguticus]|uniref:Uncharacterized protein n=1 Tax=Anisodus tanguticus TaxID=243964 RepID=A0AAE1VE09_9SOLA|nr:hypothetical protein RND71_014278 [Anisodus tanguticus]
MILHHLDLEGLKYNEQFLAASLIEKLPPSWNEFLSYLKLKTKKMTFEELIIKLQIQEDNKKALPRERQPAEAKENLAEAKGNPSKKRKFQNDGKTQAIEKFKGNCHHCENLVT